MIYELRTYWAAPGKAEAMHRRFRTLTLGVFERHNLQVVGFWTPTPVTAESGDLVYMLRFADEEQMKAAWEAFRADAEWIAGKAASEIGGTLVTKVTSMLLRATDYSPEV